MFATLAAFAFLSYAAVYQVLADPALLKLPLTIGWAAWTVLVLFSSFLAWTGLAVFDRLGQESSESFIDVVKRTSNGQARALPLIISLACSALLLRITFLLFLPVMLENFASGILVAVIITLLMLMTFVYEIDAKNNSFIVVLSSIYLVAWLFILTMGLASYPVMPASHLFITEKLLDLDTVWQIGTVLSMGALMPIARPEVCRLFNLPRLPPLALSLLPQLIYAFVSLYSCLTFASYRYEVIPRYAFPFLVFSLCRSSRLHDHSFSYEGEWRA